jgi:hypothetical protein
MVIAAFVYWINNRGRNTPKTIIIFTVTGAALVDFGQAAAIYPADSLYYPVLIFGLAFSTALIWSVAIDRLRIVQRVRQRIESRYVD